MTQGSSTDRAGTRSMVVFMAATAMATTVSTLAATAMVRAETAAEPTAVAVTCECDPPTPPVAVASEPPPVPAASPTSSRVAEPPRVPRVRQAKAEVDGGLDKDILRRVVRAHINEVRYCYNEGLTRDPELGGRVAVQFKVGRKGAVTEAAVATSDLGDEAVGDCIAGAVARWKFPRPADGAAVTVTYPFVLSPG